MTVAAILKDKGHNVVSVGPDESIMEVTRTLARHRIGAVLVRDDAGIVGILSERDIVRSLANNGAAVLQMTAGQIMTRSPQTAAPATSVQEAMEIMTTGRFRHLPVLGENGSLVGMISIGDVVKRRIVEAEQEAESLKAYVAGAA